MSPTRHHWTKAEAEYRECVRAQGCVCCRLNLARFNLRATGMPVEVHHITDCGRQLGNAFLAPLCTWHHRALCIFGRTSTQMLAAFGPSLAKGSKPFHEKYGGDTVLLALTNRIYRSAA